jgi:hypothetical protein
MKTLFTLVKTISAPLTWRGRTIRHDPGLPEGGGIAPEQTHDRDGISARDYGP